MTRVTIADVAIAAGVSKTAVSFAFNNPEKLGTATLERVYTHSETLKSLGAPPRHYLLDARLSTWSEVRPLMPVTISLFTTASSAPTSG